MISIDLNQLQHVACTHLYFAPGGVGGLKAATGEVVR